MRMMRALRRAWTIESAPRAPVTESNRHRSEPIIGHTKADGMLERNHLAGARGDAINAIIVAAGHNMRLLVAWLIALWRALLTAFASALTAQFAAA